MFVHIISFHLGGLRVSFRLSTDYGRLYTHTLADPTWPVKKTHNIELQSPSALT